MKIMKFFSLALRSLAKGGPIHLSFLRTGLPTIVLLATVGCAVVSVKTPTWSAFGGHLFETPKGQVIVSSSQSNSPGVNASSSTVKINYESKVDGEALGTAAGTAIKTAIK